MKRLAALACLALAACAPTPSDFLSATRADTSHRMLRLPFEHSWRTDDEIPPGKYRSIVIAPVTLAHLDSSHWKTSRSEFIPDKATWESETMALANRWNSYLKEQFSSPVCSLYLSDDRSDPKAVIIETAIIRNTFARPFSPASVSFEARFKDAATGRILGTAADTRRKNYSPDDFNRSAFANPNDDICEAWAIELMEATNRELFPVVWRR